MTDKPLNFAEKAIFDCLEQEIAPKNIELEQPPQDEFGDLSCTSCLALGEEKGENPRQVAEEIKDKLDLPELVDKVEIAGPGYLNFFFDRKKLCKQVIERIKEKGKKYGRQDIGEGKNIVIDYSAPNIAKPMSIGHLRSTIIGDSVYKILEFLGYNCIGDNHLGDWGTQFGKLLYAWQQWGSEAELDKNPIDHLLDLYVKFHDKAEEDPTLEEKGRQEFKKLEGGDQKAKRVWQRFKELSMREFHKTYQRLGVDFDYELGESFYLDMLSNVIQEALDKKIAERDEEGAVIVEFEDMPSFLIQKSDGTTLYQTRDLATLKYRQREFDFAEVLYVVGSEQNLHFQQLFETADRMGYADKDKLVHVNFGMMRLPEGAMSTRKGRVVFLEDVLNKAQELALEEIQQKNPEIENKEKVADKVGIAAVKYADLSKNRIKDVEFDWDKAISFEGDSGPYLQYSYARAEGIINKAQFEGEITNYTPKKIEFKLAKQLNCFTDKTKEAGDHYEPHRLANYLNQLAELFNSFYHECPVKDAEDKQAAQMRLALVQSFKQVMGNGLRLLGISPLSEM